MSKGTDASIIELAVFHTGKALQVMSARRLGGAADVESITHGKEVLTRLGAELRRHAQTEHYSNMAEAARRRDDTPGLGTLPQERPDLLAARDSVPYIAYGQEGQ